MQGNYDPLTRKVNLGLLRVRNLPIRQRRYNEVAQIVER